MKKVISILISSVMVLSIFTSLPINSFAAKKAKKVSLKKSSVTLKIREKNGKVVYGTTKIKLKKAKGVTVKKVTYKSLNKRVATVSKKGKVTAKAHGNIKIKVKVKYKYKKKSYTKILTFKVKVNNTMKKASSITSETSSPEATTAENLASTEKPEETTDPNYAPSDPVAEYEPEATTEPAEYLSTTSCVIVPTAKDNIYPTDSQDDTEPSVVQDTTGVTKPDRTEDTTPDDFTTAPSVTEPETKAADFNGRLSAFSNKLYNMCSADAEGNYVMSPVSVYMALTMLYQVGDDGVKDDIKSLMNMDDADLEKAGNLFNSLIKEFETYDYEKGENVQVGKVNLTNSIWIDDNLKVDGEALKELADKLFCESKTTPFKNDNEAANKEISEFIKEKTNGLIDKDFNISPSTLFSLINTLYFKDIWDYKGEMSASDDNFKTDAGIKKCEFLRGKYIRGKIQETDTSYYFYTTTANGYKVKFIMPKDGCTLAEAMSAKNVNAVNFDKEFDAYDEDGTEHFTRCDFPSFKIENDTPVKDIFKKNNVLQNAFNYYESDLVPGTPLVVSDIKHTAVLDVNKKGIEGAAVTIIANEAAAMPIETPQMYHTFKLNKNFGFILTDPNDVILFEGQIKDPAPDKEVVYNVDLDFALNFNIGGGSSYNGSTGELIKTTDYYKRNPIEYKTYLPLNDEQKKTIKEALSSLNLEDYPEKYNPFAADEYPMMSTPSQRIVFRIGTKTVTCADVSLGGLPENEKGKKFMEAVYKIKSVITSTNEWNSLPDFEVLYD